ncbi:MAG: hypothetical protein J7L08_02730 [Candidatus Aenigmarchaeota archaeon]|nr:hypothetical protein [Candidatus Aenigmarchaeota archaeon]
MNIVNEFLKRGFLVSPDVIDIIKDKNIDDITSKLGYTDIVLTKNLYNYVTRGPSVKIISEYKKDTSPKRITYFLDFYNNRLNVLRNILKEKVEFKDTTSINKLNYGSEATIIGMVRDIRENGFKIEDSTGSVFCITSEKVLEDEVLGLKGKVEKDGFLVNKIYYPDISLNKKVNLTKDDAFVLFTEKLNKTPSHEYSYIFTFETNRGILRDLKTEVVTTGSEVNYPNIYTPTEPFLVDIKGVKIFVLKIKWIEDLKKKLNENDPKKIITTLLRKRHFYPFEFISGDPYLLKDVPDIVFVSGLGEHFFLNYKGVSIVSVEGERGFIVNLKDREYKEASD